MGHLAIQKLLEMTVECFGFLSFFRRWSHSSVGSIPLLVAAAAVVIVGESDPDPRGNEFGRPFRVTNGLCGAGFIHLLGVHHAAVQAPELLFQLLDLPRKSLHGYRQGQFLPSCHIGLLGRRVK